MKNTKKMFLAFLAIALILASCTGGGRVSRGGGVLRDTIFSVEQLGNGNYRVFFTHDDVAGYCTADAKLGKQAIQLVKEHDGEVLATYDDLRFGDDELAGMSNCGYIGSAESGMVWFRLVELTSVPARGN